MKNFQWTDELVEELIAKGRINYTASTAADFAKKTVEDFKLLKSEEVEVDDEIDIPIGPPVMGTIEDTPVYEGDIIWVLNEINWAMEEFTVPNQQIQPGEGIKLFLTKGSIITYRELHMPRFSFTHLDPIDKLFHSLLLKGDKVCGTDEFKAAANVLYGPNPPLN